MKKRKIILFGIGIILLTLFVNISLTRNAKKDINFINVEALAGNESEGTKPGCIASGTVCVGMNAEGEIGVFAGLGIKE